MSNRIVIGYQNLFETASSVTASSEVAGFEVENVYNWKTFDFWKPNSSAGPTITIDMGSAVDVDYFAMAAYDLSSAATHLVFHYSNDNFSADDNVAARFIPLGSDPGVVFIALPSVINERYFRFEFSGGGSIQPVVGILAFGKHLAVPAGAQYGFAPPHMSLNDEVLNSQSQGGAFLGRSLKRSGVNSAIQINGLTPGWVRGEWLPFMEHAELKPFFLDWSNRGLHNLIRDSEDFSDTAGWDDSAARWSIVGPVTDPDGGTRATQIQIDTTQAIIRQKYLLPAGAGEVYSVRFWGKLISGTLTASTVDVAEGASSSFTLTSSWQEFQVQCTSGSNDFGNIDWTFQMSSGTPNIALTDMQVVKGTKQLPYQKTDNHTEESVFAWTEGRLAAPIHADAGNMSVSLQFAGLK